MSWSFSRSGPALEVAVAVEKQLAVMHDSMTRNRANEDEVALMARAAHMIVVACHGMKGKNVEAHAHGSFNSNDGHWVHMQINPLQPPAIVKEPKGEPEPEKEETKPSAKAKSAKEKV